MSLTDPPPSDLARSFALAAEQGSALIDTMLARNGQANQAVLDHELDIAKSFMHWAAHSLLEPYRIANAQHQFWRAATSSYGQTWLNLWSAANGQAHSKRPKPIADESWQAHFLFAYIRHSYLITAGWLRQTVARVEGFDLETERRVAAYTERFVTSLGSSNFEMLSPQIFERIAQSNGDNLVKSFKQLLAEVERGQSQLQVIMTDSNAFSLGVNIAGTPGKVVWQNEIMQLIEYLPETATMARRPLLVIPPWFNKYYLFDLRERNSWVKWCVESGQSVYMISWVNPQEAQAALGLSSYLQLGILEALRAIESLTGETEVNAMGYCLGGTLLACAMAYIAACGGSVEGKKIHSATLLGTLTEFSRNSDIDALMTPPNKAPNAPQPDTSASVAFSMVRTNDLTWSFVLASHLFGREAFPFDFLHWIFDFTRFPAKVHQEFIDELYIHNRLAHPGELTLLGQSLDLSQVAIPIYVVAGSEDHVSPWKAVYRSSQHFKASQTRFILASGGHITSFINPPSSNKYAYWTGAHPTTTPQDWLDTAERHCGSWWCDWSDWLKKQSGGMVNQRRPNKRKINFIEDAPGSYARGSR